MINLKQLSNYVQGLLNEYGLNYNKNFKVYADAGELKLEDKRYGKSPKTYTSGILELISSQLTNVGNCKLSTFFTQLTLYVDYNLNGINEENESINLINTREILTLIQENLNGTTSAITIDDETYNQALVVSAPTVGLRGEVGNIADAMPMYLQINFALVSDGLNSKDCKLYINNVEVPFTQLVITRNRTADNPTFAGNTTTSTVIQAQSISYDLALPALKNNELSSLIMRDIIKGSNSALSVVIKTPLVEDAFIGTFGTSSASLDILSNVGYNISVVKTKENIVDYDSNWNVINYSQGVLVSVSLEKGNVIYWGDGTYAIAEETKEYNHSYTDDITTHIIKIFVG